MNISNERMIKEMQLQEKIAKTGDFNATLSKDAASPTEQKFANLLTGMIDNVNHSLNYAGDLKSEFAKGNPNVSLVDTKIASEISGLKVAMLQATTNKVIQAYKEISNMSI